MKLKIKYYIDPCVAFEAVDGPIDDCDIAGDCKTGTYTCVVHPDGVPGCSLDGPEENEDSGVKCVDVVTNESDDQWTCDDAGTCVGKKIFIVFRIKHLNW